MMNSTMITPERASTVAQELFVLLHPGRAEWFDVAWKTVAGGTVPVGRAEDWQTLAGLGAAGIPADLSQRMARDFAALATTCLIESPIARSELLARLKDACTKRGHARAIREWLTRAAEEILDRQAGGSADSTGAFPTEGMGEDQDCLVWDLKANDILAGRPERYTGSGTASACWARRKNYDLFIHGRMVYAPQKRGDAAVELGEREYRALVTLLLSKGNPVKPLTLYKIAYEYSGPVQGLNEKDILASHLRTLVSRLRGPLSTAVPGLKIPDQRKLRGYAVQGPFTVCLVLPLEQAASFLKPLESADGDGAQPA